MSGKKKRASNIMKKLVIHGREADLTEDVEDLEDEGSKHGGSRENSGRYAELRRPRRVLMNLERDHVFFLDRYAKKLKLRGRSAVARLILDQYINRHKRAQERAAKKKKKTKRR